MLVIEPRHNLPPFVWDETALHRAEWLYLAEAGQTAGAALHLTSQRQTECIVAALTEDAAASLELEGTLIPREEMEACIRSRLGLAYVVRNSGHCAEGLHCCMADLATALLHRGNYLAAPTQAESVRLLEELGARLGGAENTPPSRKKTQARRNIRRELDSFSAWFTAKDEFDTAEAAGTPVTQAGLTHLWFEAIHPFRFGSGIAGRVLAENALLWRHPAIPYVPISPVLLQRQNDYYAKLDDACRDRDATEWLLWFAEAATESLRRYRERFAVAL